MVLAATLSLCGHLLSQPPGDTALQQYPVIPGDLPDPSILRVGNLYYATGTSSEWAPHYPLYTSGDLVHWKRQGYVFPVTPGWAAASYWAPELFYHKGTFYVYYCARRASDGVVCIGVATSKDPLRQGFTDHGVLLQWGKEAIDPYITEDSNKLYMSFKAYGLDNRPIELLCVPLSDDGLQVTGEAFSLLRDEERKGLEGQCLVKRDDGFYLFYSSGDCCGRACSYRVGVAKASSLRGPYTRYENNPVLTESENWTCTGHGTLTTTADGRYVYLYHAYNRKDNVYTGRQPMLGDVSWDRQTGWPAIKPLNGTKPADFYDDFSGKELRADWMWDNRHATPAVRLANGTLRLSGTATPDNPTGIALAVRPFSGSYEASLVLTPSSGAGLAGLVLYGDADASAGIGVRGDSVWVWEVKENRKNVIRQAARTRSPVKLKMVVTDGYKIQFYFAAPGTEWQEIKTGNGYYDGSFLPRWDRSPRPGIMVKDGAGIFGAFGISCR